MRWKIDRTISRYSPFVQKIASSMNTRHDRELPSSASLSALPSREREENRLGRVELMEVLRVGIGFHDALLGEEVDHGSEDLDIALLSLLRLGDVRGEID